MPWNLPFPTLVFLLAGLAGACFTGTASALSSNVVLAEIYAGGGLPGAPYRNDYILLFNRGSTAVNLNNWSVQYAGATGSAWAVTTLPDVAIPAGGYYLIQEASAGDGGDSLPLPDLLVGINPLDLSETAGKVALVNDSTPLPVSCPSGANLIDLVGYGPSANCSENAPAPATGVTTAVQRLSGGCTETDTNANDFVATTPNPRHSSSPIQSCTVAGSLPQITTSPSNQTVWSGGSASFAVTATGTAPLFYQWRLATAALVNETNSTLVLSNLLGNRAGNYDVIVSNATGSATSLVAVLTVRTPLLTNIIGLRRLVDSVNYLPVDTTNLYQVEGIVTTRTNLASAGNALFYIQDATAGIAVSVSDSPTPGPKAGDLVRVTGPLGHTNGLLQLNLAGSDPTHGIITNSSGNPLPAPAPFSFSNVMNVAMMETNWEGRLVVVSNVFFEQGFATFPNPGIITLTNRSRETFPLRIDHLVAELAGQPAPFAAEAIIGVLAQSDPGDPRTSGYQILPTRRADIVDALPPAVTASPSNQVAECVSGSAEFTVTATGTAPLSYQWRFNGGNIPGATNSVLSITPTTPGTAGGYAVVVSNGFGSITSGLAILALADTTPPGLVCPGAVTVQCDGEIPPPNFAGGTLTDSCDPSPVVVHMGDVTNGICPKTIARTYKATDASSNAVTCTQVITVQDTTPPAISCGQSTFLELGQVWDFDTPVVTDNCSGPTTLVIVSTVTNRTCGNTFVATRIWKATDLCGNTTFCTQVVIIVDFTPPTVTCPTNLTVPCDAGVPAADFAGGVVDDAGDAHPRVLFLGDVTNGSCPKIITRSYRVTDACGNTASCSQTITVHDTTPPIAGCATNRIVECGTVWSFDAPSPIDLCEGTNVSVAAVGTVTNGLCGKTYRATRTWVIADACGNFINCSQTITVMDTMPPVLTCASNLVVDCGASWNFTNPSATDLCDGTNVLVVISDTSTNTVGGSNLVATRTWRATDTCSNVSTCSQSVTTTAESTLPLLTIRQQGTNVVICWPVGCASLLLEETASLRPPVAWAPVAAVKVMTNGQYCVTVPVLNGSRFSRLRRN